MKKEENLVSMFVNSNNKFDTTIIKLIGYCVMLMAFLMGVLVWLK